MRLVVLVPPYRPPSAISAAAAAADGGDAPVRALAERLRKGGWNLLEIAPKPGVAGELSRALAETAGNDAVVVCVAGVVHLGEEGSVLLDVDGGRVRLSALVAAVREKGVQEALFLVEAVYEGEDDAFAAAEYVDAVVRVIGTPEASYSALVGARAEGRQGGAWAFSRLLGATLDESGVRDERGRVAVSRVYEGVRAAPDFARCVPSFAHVRGATDLVLLEPTPSSPPREPVSGPLSAAPVSSGPLSSPPSSRASFEVLMASAEDAYERRVWEEALAGYKKALMLAPAEGEPRAVVYARIGEVKAAEGKRREAELNFDKALAAFPKHRRSFEALIALAAADRDWVRVLGFRRRLRAELDDRGQLLAIAELLEDKLQDVRGALEALEEARQLAPGDVNVLTRLRGVYEELGRWPKVVEVVGDLCREATDPKERGELRFIQADISLGRLRDETHGLSLLEAALEEDPAHDNAFSALVAVRTRREEWPSLERTYARLIDRHADRQDAERAWDVCRRLGLLRRDQMRDPAGALDAFSGALRCKAEDVESRAAVADLLMSKGDLDGALEQLVRMSAQAPTRVATFRKLYEVHTRRGDVDRAWLTATALEELGAADMNHQLHVDQFRPEPSSAVRAETSLDREAWDKHLAAPGADAHVASILRIVARAAAASRVDVLRAQKKLLSLSPGRKQPPTSTVSIVRTFAWASQILDTPLPDLYVYDDVPGGLGAVQGAAMATAIGPSVLSGLPVRELCFVVARHLTYYRPEHYVLVFFPTLAELSILFLAAVNLAVPAIPSATAAPIARLRKQLEPHLGQSERQELALTVTRFDEGGGRVDLGSWIRGVELTATRAGLLLAGDLAIAMRVLRREERAIADIPLDDKRADLLQFCASPSLATLRQRLGVAAR